MPIPKELRENKTTLDKGDFSGRLWRCIHCKERTQQCLPLRGQYMYSWLDQTFV